MKKVQLLLTLMLILVFTPLALAQDEIKLVLNGNVVHTDQPAQMLNGRTMVPVRFVSEAMGASVTWDGTNQTVVIVTTNNANAKADLEVLNQKQGIKILVNGNLIETDQPPVMLNGRIMVPVRFVSEALGAKVTWIKETGTVNITKEPDAINSDPLWINDYKVISSSQERADWPYFLLVPDNWEESWNNFYKRKEFTTEDGLVVQIESAEYATPLVRPPSMYSYYEHDYFLGIETRDYRATYPILMGGMEGYYMRNYFSGNMIDRYAIKDTIGYFEITFRGKEEVLERYKNIILVMVSSLHTPRVSEDAEERVILAQNLLQLTGPYTEEEENLFHQVFSGYVQREEIELGKMREYSWDSNIYQEDRDSLWFSLLVPEDWTLQRVENNLEVTDSNGKHQFNFYVDTDYNYLIDQAYSDSSLDRYTVKVWQSKLQDKEGLYAAYGVMIASGGWYVIYKDTTDSDEIIHLFYSISTGGFYVLEARLPVDHDPRLAKMLGIMVESFQEKLIR